MKAIRLFLMCLVCGSAAWFRREYVRAFLLFSGFCLAVGLAVMGLNAQGLAPLLWVPLGAFSALFLFVYNIFDVFDRRGVRLKRSMVERNLDDVYREGLKFYLNKEFDQAANSFEYILQHNRRDADAYFQLGKVYFKMHRKRPAKKMFARYLLFDVRGKWQEEAAQFLDQLK